jgi:hypothetical protein
VLGRSFSPSTAVGGSGRFRAVTGADLDKVIGPLGTNRTTTWRVGYEALITLNGRKVRWDVDENNHAVDRAHSHPMAVAFFAALDGITWTRGTGGDFVGTRRQAHHERRSFTSLSAQTGSPGEYERGPTVICRRRRCRGHRAPALRPGSTVRASRTAYQSRSAGSRPGSRACRHYPPLQFPTVVLGTPSR